MGRRDIKPSLALLSLVVNGWLTGEVQGGEKLGRWRYDCVPVYCACLFASCLVLLMGMVILVTALVLSGR